MADIEELKALVELAEDSDHELITRLRGALKSKIDGVDSARVSELETKVAQYEREALFDEAGIGDSLQLSCSARRLPVRKVSPLSAFKRRPRSMG